MCAIARAATGAASPSPPSTPCRRRAIRYWTEILSEHPDDLTYLLRRAESHLRLGNLRPGTAGIRRFSTYRGLKDSGLSKAKALQPAKIELLQQNAFAHPALWWPFILIGNWF